MRIHYFILIGDDEEVELETRYLFDLYEQFPEVVVHHPITQYKKVTTQLLTNYKNNLIKGESPLSLQIHTTDHYPRNC